MRIALATIKKNQLSMIDYYNMMSQYAGDLATSGTPLHDDEMVTYLLAGLNSEYNLIFTTVVARVDPISPSDLYAQLLSFEQTLICRPLLDPTPLHWLWWLLVATVPLDATLVALIVVMAAIRDVFRVAVAAPREVRLHNVRCASR
jgi:hypothetical protein